MRHRDRLCCSSATVTYIRFHMTNAFSSCNHKSNWMPFPYTTFPKFSSLQMHYVTINTSVVVKLCLTLQLNRIVTNVNFQDCVAGIDKRNEITARHLFRLRFLCLCDAFSNNTQTQTRKSLTFCLTDQCSVAQCNNRNWLLFKLQWGSAIIPFTILCHFNCRSVFFFFFCVCVMRCDLTLPFKYYYSNFLSGTLLSFCARNSCYCVRTAHNVDVIHKCIRCVVLSFIGHKTCKMVFVCQNICTK